MYKIADELKMINWDIFEKLYEPDPDKFVYEYSNPTRPMIVFADYDIPSVENVFICLKTNMFRGKKIFEEYFVSEEYNMNEDLDPLSSYIAGRFIFHHHIEDIVEIEAIAEEPARALFLPDPHYANVESFYLLQRRALNEPGK